MQDANPYQRPESFEGTPEPAVQVARPILPWILKSLAALFILAMLVTLFLPATRRVREPAKATMCRNQLKNIALALLNYETTFGSLPPVYTLDANGKPLHSWRTLILPYLEGRRIYEMIDFDKPWDHPANQAAREAAKEMRIFECPSIPRKPGHTTYLAVATKDGCLQTEPRKFSDVKDDHTWTLVIVDVDAAQSVEWMSPEDASEVTLQKLAAADLQHPGRFQAACLSGDVRVLDPRMPADRLRAMVTANGGDDDVASEGDE